jgi:Family of unknown function (DUF6153)
MTGRPTPARPWRTDRRLPWLVLVLLVGLLGMHGLAGGHTGQHSASMAAGSSTGAAADVLPDGPTSTTMARPVGAVGAVGAHIAPTVDHTRTALAGLCLAVLVGTVLWLMARRRSLPARARSGDRRARQLARSRVLPEPRPPDLVAGLCVSRT